MKIGLIGTFDVDNFGDCLFPELYIHELNSRIKDLEFEFFSPTSTSAAISSYSSISKLPGSHKETSNFSCDTLILIGGETISIGHSSGTYIFPLNQFSAALRLWLSPLLASFSTNGPKFIIHSVGVVKPPAETMACIASALKQTDRLSVRDKFSNEFLIDYEVESQVDIDPIFCICNMKRDYEWRLLAEKYIPPHFFDEGYLVAQISNSYLDGNIESWCNQIEIISNSNKLKIVLLPICHFLHDEILLSKAEEILRKTGVETVLVKGLINVKDTVSIISQSSGYCGTSLHGAVVSIAFAKPIAILGNSLTGKHAGVMQSVGLENVVATEINELPICFSACQKYALETIRDFAIQGAKAGLDRLVKAILSEKKTVEIDLNIIDELVDIDKSTASGFINKSKRIVLNVIKNGKISGGVYFKFINKIRKRF